MSKDPYKFVPTETLFEDEDDGTIVENVSELAALVVGHRIVKVEQVDVKPKTWPTSSLRITLDTGRIVELVGDVDCCAYTELKSFLFNVDKVDHAITGVSTSGGYETWNIYADIGDVLTLQVGWDCGNAFYYGYGFEMVVTDPKNEDD
jgi:hypothetical protein